MDIDYTDRIANGHACRECRAPMMDGKGAGKPRLCAVCKALANPQPARAATPAPAHTGPKPRKGPRHKTNPQAIGKLQRYGLPVKFADHHWKIETDEGRIDWWPTTGRWMNHKTQKQHSGGFDDFLVFLAKFTNRAPRETFQDKVLPWMLTTFGEKVSGDTLERADRFIEEALELAQTTEGFTAARAHALVDYVFGRPVGHAPQEVGGVMVTLAALCLANHMDMHHEGDRELARVWTKVEQIRAKQAAKPRGSALPSG